MEVQNSGWGSTYTGEVLFPSCPGWKSYMPNCNNFITCLFHFIISFPVQRAELLILAFQESLLKFKKELWLRLTYIVAQRCELATSPSNLIYANLRTSVGMLCQRESFSWQHSYQCSQAGVINIKWFWLHREKWHSHNKLFKGGVNSVFSCLNITLEISGKSSLVLPFAGGNIGDHLGCFFVIPCLNSYVAKRFWECLSHTLQSHCLSVEVTFENFTLNI